MGYIRWDCVCGRCGIFVQQGLLSRHFVASTGLRLVADPEEGTMRMMTVVDAASRRRRRWDDKDGGGDDACASGYVFCRW